ncbi:MAG: magnesium chelatase domain-containing protein [Ignavibacteriota bacterium]
MMFSRCFSATTQGIQAYTVEIESHIENMSPQFIMVGLPDSAVRESKERVMAAMKNSGLQFDFSKRITINLAPADIRKEGSAFDLPIALGLLAAIGGVDAEVLKQFVVLGELALDGSVRPIHGALNVALMVRDIKRAKPEVRGMILPVENSREAALVQELEVFGVANLRDAVGLLNSTSIIERSQIDIKELFKAHEADDFLDFADVKGQEADAIPASLR